jgi:hypothetical protein
MVNVGNIRSFRAREMTPHMLRHSCGYALANKGHDTSGLGAEPVQGFLAGLIVHSIAGRFQMLFATAAPEQERPPIEDLINAPQICVIKAHERRLGFCPDKRRPWRRCEIVRALVLFASSSMLSRCSASGSLCRSGRGVRINILL